MDQQQINQYIAEAVGVEPLDIEPDMEFVLDLNATDQEMANLQLMLEEELDVDLPEFSTDYPETVSELYEIIDDASL